MALKVAAQIDDEGLEASDDDRFLRAFEKGNYPAAFSRLVAISDRSTVVAMVTELTKGIAPGPLTEAIADWPFAGIITTNYDPSISVALDQLAGTSGWVAVGNDESELAKVSTGERIVWHLHGAAALPDRSRLVLTEEDYDDFYNGPSKVLDTFHGLLQHRRVVAFGYGFTDLEVGRVLRRVGRLSSPERPVYAFLGGLEGRQGQADRQDLFERSNVDVIPYRVHDGDHDELRQLVSVYGALTLRRSLRLNQPPKHTPSWDAETTALLTYNELVLKHGANLPEDILDRILRSTIVARLKLESPLERQDLMRDLAERARLLATKEMSAVADDSGERALDEALRRLVRDGLISETDGRYTLAVAGNDLVTAQGARAQLLREQFIESLRSRVASNQAHSSTIGRITDVLARFLEDCMARRGIGVALAWQASSKEARKYQITALLQHLPDFLEELTQPSEIEAAIGVVEAVLASPSDSERIYLGVRTQAQFSAQLLAFSPELIAARAREVGSTAFLLDSNVLIPLIAEGSPGHAAATRLVADLLAHGALVVTTEDLVKELRDHANWARQLVARGSIQSTEVLQAATGRAGFRENLFLAGLIAAAANAGGSYDFDRYLDGLCGSRSAHLGHLSAFVKAVEARGVLARSLGQWGDFDPILWADRDQTQDDIEAERRRRDTYRGELQVRAEAEARIIVDHVREGELTLDGRDLTQAFFVSNSRVVDFVAPYGTRVTMRMESVLQWMSTMTGADPAELSFLVDGMLWELAEEGLTVLDRQRVMMVFAPMIDASVASLGEHLGQYHALTAEEYGEDPTGAFSDPIAAPLVEKARLVQRAENAEADSAREREAKEQAERKAKLTDRERAELQRMKDKKAQKSRLAERRRRANASNPGKKRRKGKR